MGPMGPNRFGDPWFPSHLGRRLLPTTAVRPTLKWEFGEFTIQSIQKTGDNWRWDDGSPKTTDDGLSKIIPKLENHDKFRSCMEYYGTLMTSPENMVGTTICTTNSLRLGTCIAIGTICTTICRVSVHSPRSVGAAKAQGACRWMPLAVWRSC